MGYNRISTLLFLLGISIAICVAKPHQKQAGTIRRTRHLHFHDEKKFFEREDEHPLFDDFSKDIDFRPIEDKEIFDDKSEDEDKSEEVVQYPKKAEKEEKEEKVTEKEDKSEKLEKEKPLVKEEKKEEKIPEETVTQPVLDACDFTYCGRGKECQLTKEAKAECVCIKSCKPHKKPICGSDGEYYPNHCELHRASCVKNKQITIKHTKDCFTKVSEPKPVDKPEIKQDKKPELKEVEKVKSPVPDTTETQSPTKLDCSPQEYSILKDNLLLYTHAKFVDPKDKKGEGKEFLVSIMFSHYDENNNALLESEEMKDVSVKDHLNQLSIACELADMLSRDDGNKDGKLDINEFYSAFGVSVIRLDERLRVNYITAIVGNNVNIKCDITGTPAPSIVWMRNGVNLADLNEDDIKVFSDGVLYLTHVQLIHSGNYSCHPKDTKDVVQTHILYVQVAPKVQVTPRKQSRKPGEKTMMECHATGIPTPRVKWQKNDNDLKTESSDHYTILGNGTSVLVNNIAYKDTGAYTCVAENEAGASRDISSLFVQDDAEPGHVEPKSFFVFYDWGIGLYNPETCKMQHHIHSTDIIPGTQDYVCGDKGVNCTWGDAINVMDRYVYVSQPLLNRVLVISLDQLTVVNVILTDEVPVELHYVPHLDQVWVLCWRSLESKGMKTVEVIREASEKKAHHTVHPEPVNGHYDLVQDLFIPPAQELGHKFKYGYAVHSNQHGLYKIDLSGLKYVKTVDLSSYACGPKNIVFSSLGGYVIIECVDPLSNKPKGQVVMDYLTDSVLTINEDVTGKPFMTPDSSYLVTLDRDNGVIRVQEVSEEGIKYSFDVKTALHLSDITFYPSHSTHSYDMFASSVDKADVLFLDLAMGKVDVITGVGKGMDPALALWNQSSRVISSSGVFGTYVVTPADRALFVVNGQTSSVNCEIGKVDNARKIVWINHS